MARSGRPKSLTQKVPTKVVLRQEHYNALEYLDHDPYTDKRIYASRNIHIEKALTEYFAKYYPKLVQEPVA
jgi:hypothetical protein